MNANDGVLFEIVSLKLLNNRSDLFVETVYAFEISGPITSGYRVIWIVRRNYDLLFGDVFRKIEASVRLSGIDLSKEWLVFD